MPIPRIPYPDAIAEMDAHVDAMIARQADERVWMLEHPPCYTAGRSARVDDLLQPRFPVFETPRGGQYTYHGPGQLVCYVMRDLTMAYKGAPDIRRFVGEMEQAVIDTLAHFGVTGERRAGRVGVWVVRADGREDKIAALGVRVRKWITSHGLSINVHPNLSHYDGIVPCGIDGHGVTSLADLGLSGVTLDHVAQVLGERV